MIRPRATVISKKKFLSSTPGGKEIINTLNRLHTFDDRSMAIIGMSIFGLSLERLLKSRIRQDLNQNDINRLFDPGSGGYLSNFDAQLRVAFALGWIPQYIYEDALIAQGIRNVFAHTAHEVNFSNETIIEDCEKLSLKIPAELKQNEGHGKSLSFIRFRNMIFFYTLLIEYFTENPSKQSISDMASEMPVMPQSEMNELINSVLKSGADSLAAHEASNQAQVARNKP